MTILKANLKHLYQRRGLWLWYLLLLCQLPLVALPLISHRLDRFLGYLVISYMVGLLVFSLQQDITAKPFSFCMPGHRKISRKVIMLVGIILNAFLGMVFLAYPGLTFPYSLLVAIAGGFVGMTVYLLSVRIMAKGSQGNIWLGLTPFYIFGAVLMDIDRVLQIAMVSQPLIFIAVCSVICWLIWRWLCKDSLARDFCGKIIPGMLDGFNARKLQKMQQSQIRRKIGNKVTGLQISVEEFFLSKMHKYKFLSRSQYVWGSLYAGLGAFSVFLKPWSLLGIIGLVLYFGYCNMGYFSIGHMIFLFPAVAALSMKLPAYPNLLLPGGRREIFTGVLASAFSITIITGVVMIILAIISHLIEPLLPPLHFKKLTFSYLAMDIGKFYLFLLIMPIALSTTVISKRWPMLKFIMVMALMQVVIFWNIVNKHLEITIPPVTIPIAVIACWLIFVMVAHRFCMKRCLVSQTKG